MKITKLISIMAVLLGFGVAHAETTVGGELFANFGLQLDAGDQGAGDLTKTQGFDVTRARVNATHKFNDSWGAQVGVDAYTGTATLTNAYLWGKDVLASGDTMKFGQTYNEFYARADMYVPAWITDTTASALAKLVTTAGGDRVTFNKGVTYGYKFNDMFAATAVIQNTESGATGSKVGYQAVLDIKPMDALNIAISYQANPQHKVSTDLDSASDSQDGNKYIDAIVAWSNDMLDVSAEYSKIDPDDIAGTAKGASAYALGLNWKYAEGKAVYAHYTMGDSDLKDTYGVKSKLVIGPTFQLAKDVNTGVFYEMLTAEPTDANTSALMWKWGASF